MPPKEIPLSEFVGKRYGSWTILGQAKSHICPKGSSARRVKARCDCGIVKNVLLSTIKQGTSTNCGCISKEIQRKAVTKHGLSKHPLYNIFHGIKMRCYNKQDTSYKYYGARGITMCDEWNNNVQGFIEWALTSGWQQGLTIDRINNNGNYTPNNCRFITHAQNTRNSRLLWETNTSGYRGVSFNRAYEKYVAYIDIDGRRKALGCFLNAVEAAQAYDKQARIANDGRPLNFNVRNP